LDRGRIRTSEGILKVGKFEMIIDFVKQNLDMMLREDFPHDLFMDRRKSFFIESRKKDKKRYGEHKEIAKAAISYMIRVGMLKKQNCIININNELMHLLQKADNILPFSVKVSIILPICL
jgi:hypothetical protein